MSTDNTTSQTGLAPRVVEQRIGREYVETSAFDGEDTDETAALYEVVARRHEILYEQIPVPVIWTHDDPYTSADELRRQVEEGFASPRFEQRSFPAPTRWIELCKRVFV